MLKKFNINYLFALFLLSHLIIWTFIPSFSNINLPLDTIEALAWGSNLQWGFAKHPPFSALMVELFFKIFERNDWAYYLLSQIFVIISFIYVWKFSNKFFKNRIFSLLSVLILEGIVFLNYTTPEFNVYVCQLPFRVLTVYYCWKCINKNKILDWALMGVFAAAGFLTHYSFVFLIIAISIFFIVKSVKEKFNLRYLLPGSIFLLILSPHLLWLLENDFATIYYALGRTGLENRDLTDHIINPLIFLLKQIVILIPVILMFLIISSKKKIKINFKNQKILFLISINLLPLILVFLTSLLTGAKIRTMWMSTFYLFFGVLIFYIFQKRIILKKIGKFVFLFIFLFIISPITYLYVSLSNDFKRTDYPGKEIAYLVQSKWDNNYSNEIKIVVGDEWGAGNLSYHLKSRPKWFNSIENKIAKIDPNSGIIYIGQPEILKKICPGVYGKIEPLGYCMIGKK
jgi:4-amino-4-deoxy-L-arabinose transferase-like glycosyltransferase